MLIKLKGVQRVKSKGRIYYYHRPSKTRLKSPYGSAEFIAEVRALEMGGKPAPKDRTLGALIEAYKQSDEFKNLAARTQRDYLRVIDNLKPLHDMPLEQLQSDIILGLRDRLRAGRRAKNYLVQVLHIILQWGKPRKWVTHNAASGIEELRRPKQAPKANRPWTLREYATVMRAAPEHLRTPIALAFYTGHREGDVLKMKWGESYNGRDILMSSGKTGVDSIWMPCPADLKAVLDAEKERRKDTKVKAMTIVVGQRGRPLTEDGFRANFFKLIRQLKNAGKVQPGLTFHGLRHTLATAIADDGGDNRDVMAILGHTTEKMAMHYTKLADRKRRASAVVRRLDRKRNRRVKHDGEKCKTTKEQAAE